MEGEFNRNEVETLKRQLLMFELKIQDLEKRLTFENMSDPLYDELD